MRKLITLVLSATIILCPLYILRAQILIPTTLLEGLIFLSVIVVAIDFFLNKERFSIFRSSFDLLIWLFLLSAAVATAVSVNPVGGLGILKAYFIEPVLFYYCLLYTVRKYHDSSFISKSLLICGVWLSVLAFVQGITGKFSLAPNEIAQGRVSAVYNSANSLALFIGPLTVFAAGLFFSEKRRRKIFYALIFIFFTAIMLWTKSRGGLVGEIFSLLVFIYAVLAKKVSILRKFWMLVPVLILAVLSFFLIQTILAYKNVPSSSSLYVGGDTLQIRYYLWEGTVNLLHDHPIFGAGLDGFKTLYGQKYKLAEYPEDLQYPHDIFLNFWAETGLFGLIVFVVFLIRLYQKLISTFPKSKNFYIQAALLAALTYWVIHGIVDVPYFKNDLSLEFWVVVALVEVWTRTRSS